MLMPLGLLGQILVISMCRALSSLTRRLALKELSIYLFTCTFLLFILLSFFCCFCVLVVCFCCCLWLCSLLSLKWRVAQSLVAVLRANFMESCARLKLSSLMDGFWRKPAKKHLAANLICAAFASASKGVPATPALPFSNVNRRILPPACSTVQLINPVALTLWLSVDLDGSHFEFEFRAWLFACNATLAAIESPFRQLNANTAQELSLCQAQISVSELHWSPFTMRGFHLLSSDFWLCVSEICFQYYSCHGVNSIQTEI